MRIAKHGQLSPEELTIDFGFQLISESSLAADAGNADTQDELRYEGASHVLGGLQMIAELHGNIPSSVLTAHREELLGVLLVGHGTGLHERYPQAEPQILVFLQQSRS